MGLFSEKIKYIIRCKDIMMMYFIIVPDNTRVVKPMIDIFYEKVY